MSVLNDPEILCPACGYDLRAIDSDRCPECGSDIDRTGLSRSQIPWTFRGGSLGRWRAYWRTVWLAMWRMKLLGSEIARPVDLYDAKRFATITALLAALPIALAVVGTMIANGGTNFLNPLVERASYSKRGSQTESLLPEAPDAQIPYAAGLTRWPVVPLTIVLLLWLCTRVPALWFDWGGRHVSPTLRERAEALSYYTSAALVLLLVAMLAVVAIFGHWFVVDPRARGDIVLDIVLALSAGGLVLIAFALWWLNALRLMRPTLHAPARRILWTALALPLTWAVCAVVAFIAFPWLAGYLWLMVESITL